MKRILMLLLVCTVVFSCQKKDPNVVTIKTNFGDIKVKLYEDTPRHRENFLKLVKDGFYEGILFHRVINHFMIQAGDPDSRKASSGAALGESEIGYTIDAEILPQHFHRKGVLAAAREGDQVNPERKSSGSHFYLAQGKVFTPQQLDSAVITINKRRYAALVGQLKQKRSGEIEACTQEKNQQRLAEIDREIEEEARQLFGKEELVLSEEQKEAYTTVGGIPHLDGAYTVFGEIVEGTEVLDKIAAVKTDKRDRPLEDVVILKME